MSAPGARRYHAFKHVRRWLVINLDNGQYTGSQREPHQFRNRRQATRWIEVLEELDRRKTLTDVEADRLNTALKEEP